MDTRKEIEQWYVEFGGDDSLSAEAERKVAFRLMLADAWDAGASRAGRYGHEDGWYDAGPHRDNPYRTEDEIVELHGEAEEW